MLAKLFDDISIASLIRSLVLAMLLFLALFLLVNPAAGELQVLNWRWEIPAIWLALIGIPILSVSVIWFNSSLIAIPLLKSDYQPGIVAAILMIPVLVTEASLNLVLLIPFMVLLLSKLFTLAERPEISFVLFDAGTIIGLMLFLEPMSLFLILLIWLGLINYGRFGLKELLIPLVGLGAVWLLTGSIIYWNSGMEELEFVFRGLVRYPFGVLPKWNEDLWRAIPLIILFIPSMLQLLNVYSKVKVLQRQSLGLMLLYFAVVLIVGAVFYKTDGLWIWMALPLAVFIVNLIQSLRKNWMKDLIYLVLLAYLILFLF